MRMLKLFTYESPGATTILSQCMRRRVEIPYTNKRLIVDTKFLFYISEENQRAASKTYPHRW